MKCGDIMFAQKKKKSKLWLVIPVLLALAVGLWLNSGFDSGNTSEQGGEEDAVQAGSDQYEDISDLSGIPDSSLNSDFSNNRDGVSDDYDDRNGSDLSNSEYDENISGDTSGEFSDDISDENSDIGSAPSQQGETARSGQYAGKIVVIVDNDGSITVYKYDSKGNVTSESETGIELSMLTETDKQLFTKGIIVNDESELSELLQDFEG